MSVAMLCGTLLFTGCSKDDNPVVLPDDDPVITVKENCTDLVGVSQADWNAAGVCATQFAPAVVTADGRTSNMMEKYETTVETVGELLWQTIEGLENGKYEVTLYANAFFTNGRGFESDMADGATDVAYVFANDQKAYLTCNIATATAANGEYTMEVEVTDGTLKLGLAKDKAGTNWHTIQIKSLYFFKEQKLSEAYAEVLEAAAVVLEMNMSAEAKAALVEALAAEQSEANLNALNEALANAVISANLYSDAEVTLTAMKALVDATNVYTPEALNEYYTKWADKFADGTLTAEEIAALQNPDKVTGWHAALTVDNFLLSAWDTNPDFQDAPYYINSWSVEGDSDGSDFHVPFFEYWVGDGDSLGERTLTATLNGVKEGDVEVSAWVRVRAKNGFEAPATGITLQVNDGEAVNVCDGAQVGESQFFLKDAVAKGKVGADGVLKIKFIVAAENNISWLSFKNVMYK